MSKGLTNSNDKALPFEPNLDKLVALTRDSKTINAAVVREAQNA